MGRLKKGTTFFALMSARCPVCRMMRPDISKLLAKFPGVIYYEADAMADAGLMLRLNVSVLPLLLIHRDGKKIHASEGAIDVGNLETKLR